MNETKTRKRESLSPNKRERQIEGAKIWIDFYRQNPYRFVQDYLGINLKPFQIVMFNEIDKASISDIVCTRGLGKSFIIALYCVVRAILYPGSRIVVSCDTKDMSRRLLTEKVQLELMNMSKTLKRELNPRNIKAGTNESSAVFNNGSKIITINASESVRGYRANVLVVDEYVQLRGGYDTLSKILIPFLVIPRQPKYLSNPKYKDYAEQNKQIYMSSGWFSDHFSYELYMAHSNNMLEKGNNFVCNLPLTIPNKYGLFTDEKISEILNDPNLTDEAFLTEYCGVFYDLGSNGYIKHSDINKNRVLMKAWYPPTDIEYALEKDKRHKAWKLEKKSEDELIVINCDVAFSEGSKNDNTIRYCSSSIPKGYQYETDILYSESINGGTHNSIALRLKQLFYDFEADYIVLDILGSGLAVYDSLVLYTEDVERDEKYPPMSCFNKEDKKERCGYREALPCIYGVIADGKINNDIAVTLKSSLDKKVLRFLVNDFEAKDYLNEKKNFLTVSTEEQVRLMYPYIQTTLTQSEIAKLQVEVTRYGIKLIETGTNRKDRYSSLAYLNLFIREQEKKLKKPKKKNGFASFW